MKTRRTVRATKRGGSSDRHSHGKGRCLDILKQLSAFIDDELPSDICRELRRHFGDCPNCEVFAASLRQTITLCRSRPTPALSAADRASMRKDLLKSLAGKPRR